MKNRSDGLMENDWKLLEDAEAGRIWNENLAGFADCSPFQSFEWGQFHKPLGWRPLYFAHFDEESKITAMCLMLLKKFYFKTGFIWVTGGPIGEIKTWNGDLPQAVLNATNLKRLYFRFRCDRKRDTRDALLLEHKNWSKPLFPMGSCFSMELDLAENADDLAGKLSKSWRRNLRLAAKNDLIIKRCADPDIEELRRAFEEMEASKNLPELFSEEKLENLFKYAASNLILFRCEDTDGNLLSFRAALFIGDKAVDYLAVTNKEGRNQRASFPTLWEMLLYCREKGIGKYDLGGIDPWENPGVYTFKNGTGADEVEYLGEWDWASSEALRLLANWAIRKRQTSKDIKTESAGQEKRESAAVTNSPVKRFVRQIAGFFS